MNEDEEEYCSGCGKKIFMCTKLCYIYSCYSYVCDRCRYCKEHGTLSVLKEEMVIVSNDHEKYKDIVECFIDFYKIVIWTLDESITSMESEIENGFKILQQVHNRQLPDDISRMITSYLY